MHIRETHVKRVTSISHVTRSGYYVYMGIASRINTQNEFYKYIRRMYFKFYNQCNILILFTDLECLCTF